MLAAPVTWAQDNSDCFACHGADPDAKGSRDGVEISIHVDETAFSKSVHGSLPCVGCHQDLGGAELPHADDLKRVDCGACHEDQGKHLRKSVHGESAGTNAPSCASCHGNHDIRRASAKKFACATCHDAAAKEQAQSLHGQAARRGDPLAPACVDCHGGHDMRAARDPASPVAVMNVPLLCGRCHKEGSPVSLNRNIAQDHILENYSESIHGRGLYEQGLIVTAVCTSCHTAHRILPHTDPASSIHHDRIATTCAKCHGQIERVHRKVIAGRLWEEEPHKIPSCVDCHSPHKIRRAFYPAGMANKDCLVCHRDANLSMVRDGKPVSLYVNEEEFAQSTHAAKACAQCHTEVTASRKRSCETIKSKVDCSICHAEVVQVYRTSIHGTLAAKGDADAPHCLDCHDKHATLSKKLPASPTFPRNVPALCARCHQAGSKAANRIHSEVPDIVASYRDSIHGRGLLQSGLVVTAMCADCHTPHGELPPEDPRSTVHHDNIATTCGRCHNGIEQIYRNSIHFPKKADGDRKYPSCNTCHSSHEIKRHDRADFRFQMMGQCGNCHETEAETFFQTFHGKVSQLGSSGAAKCYDCHGTHDILPATNPASALGRTHVVDTCGKCHPGSHRRFAGYLTHATHHDQKKYPWLFWTFWGMTALLVGTLTFAMIHTVAWLVRLFLSRDEWKHHKAMAKAGGGRLYQRFGRFQRALHLGMLLSFFTLAITGMMLKFSYTGWAQTLARLLGGFETTGVLHRTGAIVLFGVFFLHVRDVWKRKKADGSSWLRVITGPDTILFTVNDLKQIIQSVKWFLGIGQRPSYGRYTYWEKFDYFAVFWGVMVIGSTGLFLWFPEAFTYILPGWSVNVATIIHSDEALLAVGFIFTVHFFNTHFRPDKFPMDPVIFTGRMTLEELKYDKPAEYEELVKSGQLERYLVDPIPERVERGFRIFGFVALAIGLSLIGLIVFAMLTAYR